MFNKTQHFYLKIFLQCIYNRMHCNKGVLTLCNSQTADSTESNPVKPLALVPEKENVWLTYAMTFHLN